jgi:hypothetical protein
MRNERNQVRSRIFILSGCRPGSSGKGYPVKIPVNRSVHPGIPAWILSRHQIRARYGCGSPDHARIGIRGNPACGKIGQVFSWTDRNRETPPRTGSRWSLHRNEQELPINRPFWLTVAGANATRRPTVERGNHHCRGVALRRPRQCKCHPPPARRNVLNIQDGIWNGLGLVSPVGIDLLQVVRRALRPLEQYLAAASKSR